MADYIQGEMLESWWNSSNISSFDAMDESNPQNPRFLLSPTSIVDWNQALLSCCTDETSSHPVLHEDPSSKPVFLHEQAMDSKLTETPFNKFQLIPDSYGNPTNMFQGQFESNIDLHGSNSDNTPAKFGPLGQEISQFCNQWQLKSNVSAATASEVKTMFRSSPPNQFAAPTVSQQSNWSNPINKSIASGVRNSSSSFSVRKGESSELSLKKPRIHMPSSLPIFKVRKEKLVDRVAALQQLVSPFGKTDTASVLHETIDHIKLLHDQVTVLSNGYPKTGYSMPHQRNLHQYKEDKEPKEDLSSRGLCLVPITSVSPVTSNTSSNLWISAFLGIYM